MKTKIIKLSIVMGFLFFSASSFGVFDIGAEYVADCYAEDSAIHALYRGAAKLANTLSINCGSPKNSYIPRDTKLQALSVAVVRKDEDGYNVIEHNNITLNKPPGGIVDYLPGNINNNQWLRKQLGRFQLKDRDEIRLLSHYIDPDLVDSFSQERLKKNVHSVGFRPIQRPKYSKPVRDYFHCHYINSSPHKTLPPIIIYRNMNKMCEQPNKNRYHLCSSPISCIENGTKVDSHTVCLLNKDGSCPSATECALSGSSPKREKNSAILAHSTRYNSETNRFEEWYANDLSAYDEQDTDTNSIQNAVQ